MCHKYAVVAFFLVGVVNVVVYQWPCPRKIRLVLADIVLSHGSSRWTKILYHMFFSLCEPRTEA